MLLHKWTPGQIYTWDTCMQVDMLSNYVFRFGLREHVLKKHDKFTARSARQTFGGFVKLL